MEDPPGSEFQNLLKCTELLQTEDPFRSTVKVEPGVAKKRFKPKQVPAGSNGVKKLRTGSSSSTTPGSAPKPKPTTAWNPRVNPSLEKVLKAAAKPASPEKKKLTRPRTIVEEGPTIREVLVVDDQSVVPLSDVQGDLDFEDLVAEDLEICRYLPPVGNVQSGMKCAEISRRLKAFEQTLLEISQNGGKISTGGDETEHDSDATLSIVSDEDASASQSSAATNPPVNVSMLEAYKIVFDPPVPAVITIPTSILRVSDANDWQTEARALQFLMKKNLERRKNRTKLSQKPTVGREALPSTNDAARKRRDIAQQLFAAIEFKSNQIVSLDRPNFTILHPADSLKKPRKEPKRKISEANAVDVENPPHSKDEKFVRLSGMVDKLELDPFSRDFLENNFQFIEEKQLRKAMRQHHSFKKAMNQILLVTDESLQKELHLVLQEARDELQRLGSARERSLLVTDEKCLLDQDETEKRLATNTEKAKSHVINMFEENRRQYELQRTLDFATCKCDMLAINTRNMRKRTDAPHVRLLEEMTGTVESSSRNPNPSASPPQTAQVMLNGPQSGFPSGTHIQPVIMGACATLENNQADKIFLASGARPEPVILRTCAKWEKRSCGAPCHVQRRRRNQFAVALKEPLDDRDVYEDLANINRILKEMPERERSAKILKPVEVYTDENRLTVDGKSFYRNQQVTVEHHEHGRSSGILVQFSQNDFLVKRTTDGKTERRRYALGLLADRRVILRRRSAARTANATR